MLLLLLLLMMMMMLLMMMMMMLMMMRMMLVPVRVMVQQRGVQALRAAVLTSSGDVRWGRLSNLLGDDDALKDAAAENKARAQQTIDIPAEPSTSGPTSSAVEPAQLHMDAAEEAKRVLMELMVSSEVNPDCLLSPLGFNAPWQQGGRRVWSPLRFYS